MKVWILEYKYALEDSNEHRVFASHDLAVQGFREMEEDWGKVESHKILECTVEE